MTGGGTHLSDGLAGGSGSVSPNSGSTRSGELLFDIVVSRMLYALAPLTAIWLIGALSRVYESGWHPVFTAEAVAASMVAVFFVFRKRLSSRWVAVTFMTCLCVLAFLGLLSFGMASGGAMMALVGMGVLAAAIYGRKAGLFVTSGGVLALILTALGVRAGYLPLFVGSIDTYAHSGTAWIATASNLILISVVLVLCISAIQERMAASVATAKAESEFTDMALNAQRDMFFVFNVHTKKVERWNRAFREMTGLTDEEIESRPMPDGWSDFVDLPEVTAAMSRLIAGSTDFFETNIRRADGRVLPVEFRATVARNDALGGPLIVGVGRDMTARRSAEHALRESEERFRLVLDNVPTVVWTADTAGNLGYVSPNTKTLYGYTAEEVMSGGLPFLLPRIHEEDRSMVRDAYLATGFHRRSFECQFRFQTGDGRWVWIHHQAVPVFSRVDGKASCGVWTDITEQVSSLEKLHQAEKMKAVGELAGGVAHDFNNQLMAISGCVELLAQGMAEQPNLLRYVHHIRDCTGFAASLTHRLLAFSRKTAERIQPQDAHRVLEQTAFILERSISGEVRIALDLNASHPWVSADISRLQNSVLNLCLNARDAMPRGGDLTLSTRNISATDRSDGSSLPPGEYLCICIADTGHGMSNAVKERAFEPFFTTKPEGKGTGLGLSSVRSFVEDRKGIVKLTSVVDRGTEVSIYLPVCAAGGDALDGAVLSERVDLKGNILLVDDDTEVAKTIAAMLEEFGYRVKRCNSGRRAVDQYRRNPSAVDLVILDWVMPDFGGRETLSALREINEDIKILLASARISKEDVLSVLEDGAADYIQKPFSAEELADKVGAALSVTSAEFLT